jgi:hypothetical protein
MKKILMFMIPGLVSWMGCAAEVDGTPISEDPQSQGADIGEITPSSLHASCSVVATFPTGSSKRCDATALAA